MVLQRRYEMKLLADEVIEGCFRNAVIDGREMMLRVMNDQFATVRQFRFYSKCDRIAASH